MVDTNHYTFVKTNKTYNTKRKTYINYRFYLIIIMWQYWPFSCNKCAMLMQDVNNREIGWWRILKEYRGTLFFPLNFSINLKQIKNTPLIKKNDAHSFFSLWNVYILYTDNLCWTLSWVVMLQQEMVFYDYAFYIF